MALSWDDVVKGSEFQSLTAGEKSAVRDAYFNEVVSPQINGELEKREAYAEFKAYSDPHLNEPEGDFMRAAEVAAQQLPQLGYGLAAGAGAIGEKVFGTGGFSTAIKDAGVKGYQEWGDKIQQHSKQSDSLSYSLDQAKNGDYGALVDWMQYGLGYGGMQAIQMLATAGIGSLAGKYAAKTAAEKLASGMVKKEVAAIAATEEGKKMARDAIMKKAVANTASKIGSTTALGATAYGMEGGEIYGDLVSEAQKEGRELTGAELARAFGAMAGAGTLEFVGDKLGVDIMLGKRFKSIPGVSGRIGRGAALGAGGALIEGGTEYLQTGAEEYGKGNEANIMPFNQSEKAQNNAFDAAGLGAIGGTAFGVVGGVTSKPEEKIKKPGMPLSERAASVSAKQKTVSTGVPHVVVPHPTSAGRFTAVPYTQTEPQHVTAQWGGNAQQQTQTETAVPMDAAQAGSVEVQGNVSAPSGQMVPGAEIQTAEQIGDGTKAAPITVTAPEHIEQAAANVNTDPSDAQKEAGNYAKGHIKLHGLDIAIENPRGSERSGKAADGRPWSVMMPHHYGYIKGSTGADGDQVDVYLGDATDAQTVYVIDQIDPASGKFDETKSMLGFNSQDEAVAGYIAGFSDGKGENRIGAVTPLTLDEYRDWLKNGNHDKPLAYRKSKKGGQDVGTTGQQLGGLAAGGGAAQSGDGAGSLGDTGDFGRQPGEMDGVTGTPARSGETAQPAGNDGAASVPLTPTVTRKASGEIAVTGLSKDRLKEIAKQLGARVIVGANGTSGQFGKSTDIKKLKKLVLGEKPKKSAAPSHNLIQRIKQLGGINMSHILDITGESNPNKTGSIGLFREAGLGIDDLATQLAAEGFPVNVDDVDGGVQQLKDLIRDALSGAAVLTHQAQAERLADEAEKRHREQVYKLADQYGIRRAGRKFEDVEAEVNAEYAKAIADEEYRLDDEARLAYAEKLEEAQALLTKEEIDAVLDRVADGMPEGYKMRYFYWRAVEALDQRIQEAKHARPEETAAQDAALRQTTTGKKGASGRTVGAETQLGTHDTRGEPTARDGQAQGLELQGYTNAEIAKREAAAEKSRKEAEKEPPGKTVSTDQVDLFNTQDSIFSSNREKSETETNKTPPQSGVSVSAELPAAKKPKKETIYKQDKRQLLESHFAVGNVIKSAYWKDTDRVLDFNWNDGDWSVTVEKVKKNGDGDWVATGLPRTHSTAPNAMDVIVDRAEAIDTSSNRVEETQSKPLIEDFGEKLGGARKDLAAAIKREYTDDDIASLPLSKIWPADLADKIEDKFIAAFAFAARQEIPAKPRLGYRVNGWVEKVKILRNLSSMMMESQETRELAEELLRETKALDGFRAKVSLLESIGREQWKRIGVVKEYPNAYSYDEDGKQVPKPLVRVYIDDVRTDFPGAKSVADVIDKVNEKLGAASKGKRIEFEVRGQHGAYFINKKGDKLYRKLKTFTTSKEAIEFRDKHYDELVAAWEAVKDSDNVKESDLRTRENRERAAEDWRKGKDVTPEQFVNEFGFRGIEFGNWVNQGKNAKERQGMLNAAYDALMDLASIINVPPKALSLEGTLGLGFGSRGSGKASAHFEPDMLVINLTKTRGAGTLAHEWFHALDNYFQRERIANGETSQRLGGGHSGDFITYNPENYYVHKRTGHKLPERAFNKMIQGELHPVYGRLYGDGKDRANWELKEGVRTEVAEAFADLVKALNDSPMAKRASLIDKGKSGGYWSLIIERAARAFENYVIHKMMLKGYHNDYLANVTPANEFQRDAGRYPYLLEEEVEPVAEAFDNLFAIIKTKETDKGVALFSLGDSTNSGGVDLATVNGVISRVLAAKKDWNVDIAGVESFDALPEEVQKAVTEQYGEEDSRNAKGVEPAQSAIAVGGNHNVARQQLAGKLETSYTATHEELATLTRSVKTALKDKIESAERPDSYAGSWRNDRLPDAVSIGKIAAAFGKKVAGVTADNPVLDGLFNGVVIPRLSNIVFINSKTTRPHFAVLGHELVHHLARDYPALYQEFIDAVRPFVRQQKFTEFRNKAAYRSMDNGAVREEFLGEVVSDGFLSKRFWGALGKHSPELLNRIAVMVRNLMERAAQWMGYTPRTKEYLTDFDRVMEIAGEVMAKYHTMQRFNGETVTDITEPKFSRSNETRTAELFAGGKAKSREFLATSRLQLPGVLQEARSSKKRIYTESDLVKYRSEQAKFNRQDEGAGAGLTDKIKAASKSEKVTEFLYNFQDRFIDLRRMQQENAPTDESADASQAEELYSGRVRAQIDDFHDDAVKPLIQAIHDAGLDYDEVEEYLHAKHAPSRNEVMRRRNPTKAELEAMRDFYAKKRDDMADAAGVMDYLALRRKLAQAKADVEDGVADETLIEILNDEINDLRKSDADVREYLDAVDAIAALRRIEPFDGDNTALSGMTNSEAADVIDKAKKIGHYKALEKVSGMVNDISASTLRQSVEGGLITQEEADSLAGMWENYVPLHREEVGENGPAIGQGFNIRGKEFKRATGSSRAVTNILAHLIAQHEAAVIRSEKARVDRALYQFASENADPEVWSLDSGEMVKDIDPATGMVVDRVNPLYKQKPNVLTFKIDGKEHTIEFNERNAAAMRLAASMKNLSAQELGEVTKIMGKATRFLATMNTSANPVFVARNFLRDLQTAFVNLSDTEIADIKKEVFGNVGNAIRGMWNMARGDLGSKWAQHARDFRDAGGQTGWLEHYNDIDERADKLRRELDRMGGGVWRLTKRTARAWWNTIEDANLAVENGVRLAAYVAAVNSGTSKAKAASIAKNLTVNFNRRGAKGVELNMWYMFMNASIQGTARLVKALGNRNVQKILGYVVASGLLMDILARALAGDDDDDGENDYDQLPEYVKQNNFVFWLGRPITIPMPYGYNFFANIGRKMGEVMFRDNYSPVSAAVDLMAVAFDAFSPTGQSGSLLQLAAPTIADPFIQVAENKNFAGQPVYRKQSPFGVPKPEYLMGFNSTSVISRRLMEGLNDISGGNEVRPGLLNFNPAVLDHYIGTALGGAGRTYLQAFNLPVKAFTGDDIRAREVPFLNIVAGSKPEYQAERKFFENLRAVETTRDEYNRYRGDASKIAEIKRERPGDIKMAGMAKLYTRELERLRERERAIERQDPPNKRELLKAVEERRNKLMNNFNKKYKAAQAGA